MKAPVNSRYAHCEGITDVGIFEGPEGQRLVTCGADGDVRVWLNPEDQDPVVFSATDSCLSLTCHKDRIYVGTESNCVETYGLPKGKNLGSSAKFTAAVNHVDVSKNGGVLAAGSGDMTFQIIKLEDGAPASAAPVKIDGHTAPVLAVAIDPCEEFVASVGCDGSAYIWTMTGKQLHSWDKLFPSSNDIANSSILCRPSWYPQEGKFIAIPETKQVVAYARGTWNQNRVFKSSNIVSICKFSPCGNFLAGGCTNGTVTVWEFDSGKLIYENVDTKDHISGLVFSTCGKNIFAVDMKGRLISVMNYSAAIDSQIQDNDSEDVNSLFGDELDDHDEGSKKVLKGAVANGSGDDAFDDGMDDLFGADDELDANEISISKIKAMTGFIASEKEDVFVGIDKAKAIAGIKNEDKLKNADDSNDDDAVSISSAGSDIFKPVTHDKQRTSMPASFVMPFTEPQKPFQPSSTPEHLEHRFMTWNETGIIRNYPVDNDDTDAIDVEFHDISFHTAIHMRNVNEYYIASLGKEAAVFASKMSDGEGSKLMCLHFSSWDANKEWIMKMPKKENITGLAIGSGWLAAAIDSNRLRLFTIGGVQKGVVEIGGQIIAIAGHEDLLFVTFHNGFGLHGTQCIAYSILRIRTGTGVHPLISCEPLPLSPKAGLTWVGFSDEGTPSFNDSRDCLRVLIGRTWTVFNEMKESLTGESDHFWVTGLSVSTQNARVIKCKGMRYPATIPKPTIILLDAKIPLCETETEKSSLEDGLLRSLMLTEITKKMDKKGFDVEDFKYQAEKIVKENLMKLFALSCKGNRDYRASEYVSMMPTTLSIQLAIKYAAKMRKLALGERLAAIGRRKQDEESEGVEDFDGDFENIQQGNIIYSSVYANLGSSRNQDSYSDGSSGSYLTGTGVSGPRQNSSDIPTVAENPLLRKQRAEVREILLAGSGKSKPFRKSEKNEKGNNKDCNTESITASSDSESIGGKGLALIDVWKKPVEKPSLEFNPKGPKGTRGKKATSEKEKDGKEKGKIAKGSINTKILGGKRQTTLLQMGGGKKPTNSTDSLTGPDSPATLDAQSEDSMCDVQSVDATDEIQTERKRKRSECDPDSANNADLSVDSETGTSEKKSRISSKLALFSRASKEDE